MPPKQKKGLSLDEKKTKLLEFFTKDHTFFSIKEIETQGSKYVGVHPMQMKDLLQVLLDDDLINSEKCGISMVYWCFEHDKIKKLEKVRDAQSDRVASLNQKKQHLQKELGKSQKTRKSNKNTMMLLEEVNSLKQKEERLQSQVDSSGFSMGDLQVIRQRLAEKIALGEMYSDTVEALIHHFNKENGVSREFFKAEVGIPDEFDEFPDLNKLFEK